MRNEQGSPARHPALSGCDPSEFALSRNSWYTGVERSEGGGGVGPRGDTQVAFSEEVPVRWAHAALRDVVGAPVTCLPPSGPHLVPSASCF